MKTLKFKKIDAFTTGASSGNPAGYILLENEDILTENQMLQIAGQLSGFVNEVGFVKQTGDEFNLKFYSSECEVAFCGHATIAIMYDLLASRKELFNKSEIFINVAAGKLSVFNHIQKDDAVYIMAPEPEFLQCPVNISHVSDALGIRSSEIDDSFPLNLINAGLQTLIVGIRSLDQCLKISPDQEKLKRFCLNNKIDIILVSTKQTHTAHSRYRNRVFAPKYGYLEDPATGSGNAAFANYLCSLNLWQGDFVVEQGPDRANPNFIKLKKHIKNNKERILFGGTATIRVDGNFFLQN
ncbi:MAG: PhzF family phenazine biosynthesis protein [Proteobacteria bacterium]|nr:PhzF family phenazine biosynthesis protein [Pseudomonadota bacterium]MBU1388187.1 PhzF family phenazine biosynthesis protein [Pseudomonadota bacterium]MBU1542999.1 PhzF family phenazine biosynthesis protein [Pseudomonadota bacterium]MBU2480486.1 PhzF family phenazine biosynthesis protein [Pseudomonadota bacterium]